MLFSLGFLGLAIGATGGATLFSDAPVVGRGRGGHRRGGARGPGGTANGPHAGRRTCLHYGLYNRSPARSWDPGRDAAATCWATMAGTWDPQRLERVAARQPSGVLDRRPDARGSGPKVNDLGLPGVTLRAGTSHRTYSAGPDRGAHHRLLGRRRRGHLGRRGGAQRRTSATGPAARGVVPLAIDLRVSGRAGGTSLWKGRGPSSRPKGAGGAWVADVHTGEILGPWPAGRCFDPNRPGKIQHRRPRPTAPANSIYEMGSTFKAFHRGPSAWTPGWRTPESKFDATHPFQHRLPHDQPTITATHAILTLVEVFQHSSQHRHRAPWRRPVGPQTDGRLLFHPPGPDLTGQDRS